MAKNSLDGYTAIVSLYRHGNKETWLLTGWDEKDAGGTTGVYAVPPCLLLPGPVRFQAEEGAEFEVAKPGAIDRGDTVTVIRLQGSPGSAKVSIESLIDAIKGSPFFSAAFRTGRRKRAAKTMWKERATAPRATSEEGVAQTPETFRSRAEPGGAEGVNPNGTYAPSPSGIQAEEGAGPESTIEPAGGPVKGPQEPLYSRAVAPTLGAALTPPNRERVLDWFQPKLDALRVKLQVLDAQAPPARPKSGSSNPSG